MKRAQYFILITFITIFLPMAVSTTVEAEEYGKEVKIVWDITIGDEKVFEDRIGLIQQTADIIRKRGMTPKFVILIHGPATAFTTKTITGTKFEGKKYERLANIQKAMEEIAKKGMRITQCRIPMQRNNVSEDNILSFVNTSENVFVDLALLQMDGYAYISP